jgi:hypothetical protein
MLVPSDEDEYSENVAGMSSADRAYRHKLHYRDGDPLLKRMNRDNRRHYSRDQMAAGGPDRYPPMDTFESTSTRNARTLFRHGPLATNEKLELRGPSKAGTYDLVLVTGTSNLIGRIPTGTSGDGQRLNPPLAKDHRGYGLSLSECRLSSSSHDFLLRQRKRVKQGLHRGLAEAPSALMGPPLIIFGDPGIEVGL